ncbi:MULTISPECIES: aldo/keto reductase [Acinetobacter]|uniref:aldo/keto reductase n=1 Tax=Acinetobacter TaxID=469 RepID=UPI000C441F4B|nr:MULTISPECIES: aldo/keto reductase [Acinetobacter]MBC67815.1 aldo/keto reductase [Acinetobacter sp.]MBT50685.1 aldo/keto reductase [Acinetobacter sp.]HIQ35640.1 aldo/keto reductase [Acinetobacter venetianus]HJP46292.1 aldo/keto reductase [Acinetobacter venetianus]
MKYHLLGNSGLQVSELGFGAGTLGGKGQIFSAWGQANQAEANQMIQLCLDAGINYFDTADVYSDGESERMLGKALAKERHKNIISTKVGIRSSDHLNDVGFSRNYLKYAVEQSLNRLGTDYIDVLQLHQFDSFTSLHQLMKTLDELVRSGKVRYIGVSNFSGWQLMKAQAIADQYGYEKFVVNQVYYSLIGRDYEWELMPLNDDQQISAVVWSPLGWGRLTGKFDRENPIPCESRLHDTAQFAPPVNEEHLYRVIDVLKAIAEETGYSIPQIALNWLLQRPTVSSVLIGARNEAQLLDNLKAKEIQLSVDQIQRLDQFSEVYPPYPYYPYWNGQFTERFKSLVDSQYI